MSSAIPAPLTKAGAAEGGGDDLVMTAARTEQVDVSDLAGPGRDQTNTRNHLAEEIGLARRPRYRWDQVVPGMLGKGGSLDEQRRLARGDAQSGADGGDVSKGEARNQYATAPVLTVQKPERIPVVLVIGLALPIQGQLASVSPCQYIALPKTNAGGINVKIDHVIVWIIGEDVFPPTTRVGFPSADFIIIDDRIPLSR
jgi:hypothetical protein